MQDSLIDQGINLMLYGMGTVFVFLTILVFATGLMSKIVRQFGANEVAPAETSPSAPTRQNTDQPSARVLTAIKKAIAEHRAR